MSNGNERSTLGNRWWCHEVGQEIQKEEPSRVGNKQREERGLVTVDFKMEGGHGGNDTWQVVKFRNQALRREAGRSTQAREPYL